MDNEQAFGELIHDYVAECLPLVEEVADAFLALERRWRAGDRDADAVAALKNTLHTLKGNSAMMGLRPMQQVAHALEDLCARVLADDAARGPETAALLVEGAGLLADLIRTAAAPEADRSGAEPYVQRVRDALAAPATSSVRGSFRLDRSHAEARGDHGAATIRVDFRRLDALLEIFGEAMIEQAALPEIYRRLVERFGRAPEIADLDRVIGMLEVTMKRLERALMETRLLPIASVFGRFNRLVRDLAHAERKLVRVAIEGGDTRVDKAILDRLGEPLVHLVSNAVVHGVEPEAERRRLGKPAEATLTLRAAALADHVVVTVADDGRGLDTERILARARALGLGDHPADPAEVHRLIFLPGFSTADHVSEVAGRGVGLDAAAAAIHALGGGIDVRSEPGQGTAFTLTLPLTLAIVRSLIVEIDRERYAVPLSHVAETGRVDERAIHAVHGRGLVMWRGAAIPASDGGALLGTTRGPARRRSHYVVLFAGPRRRSVLVDRLVGHQDVVVKGLDPALGRPSVVSGATILGDGRVACILDAVGIVGQREVA